MENTPNTGSFGAAIAPGAGEALKAALLSRGSGDAGALNQVAPTSPGGGPVNNPMPVPVPAGAPSGMPPSAGGDMAPIGAAGPSAPKPETIRIVDALSTRLKTLGNMGQ